MMKFSASLIFLLLISGCSGKTPADSYKAFIENEVKELNKVPNVVVDEQFKSEVDPKDPSATQVVGTCVLDLHREHRVEGIAVIDVIQLEMKHGLQDGKWVLTAGSGKYVGVEARKNATSEQKRVGEVAAQQNKGRTFTFTSIDDLKKSQLQ
jgi:PBP1b-binding outer membrane lipoprotein LpoB